MMINNVEFSIIEKEYIYNKEDVFFDNYALEVLDLLTPVERKLLIMYIEAGSMMKLSKILGCSKSLVGFKIKPIKDKYVKLYKEGLCY
jgi:hypothetical protein